MAFCLNMNDDPPDQLISFTVRQSTIHRLKLQRECQTFLAGADTVTNVEIKQRHPGKKRSAALLDRLLHTLLGQRGVYHKGQIPRDTWKPRERAILLFNYAVLVNHFRLQLGDEDVILDAKPYGK